MAFDTQAHPRVGDASLPDSNCRRLILFGGKDKNRNKKINSIIKQETDPETAALKKQRFDAIKQMKELKEADLPDVKMENQMKLNRLEAARGSNGR